MRKISDELLLESYNTAIDLKLSLDFIFLLKNELFRRSQLI